MNMEFSVPTKAKKITLYLIIVGAVLTLIGIANNYKSDFFSIKILTNGLINAFFFFALGLGALFFLALQYATETGWYASVKRIIESIAGFLPYGMGILGLVLLIITLKDGAHIYLFIRRPTHHQ